MTMHLGDVSADRVLYIPFASYGANGESITLTGLAITDIEIFKNGGTTQRAGSDSGITLLDTDGIDFDGITGIHGFSIDLQDDTDAGFYALGSFYWVIVSAVTINAQTVNFVAATFRIVAMEGVTGFPKADVGAIRGDEQSAIDLKDFADAGYDPGANKVNGVVLVDTTTTNTDMRGTDSAALASVCTEARLAELDAANLPTDVAAVKTDTGNLVTRIPAALFSGITSLAQWLGLIAGKQVGDATARTELRATGAGSGTFDETTDSQEAIKDAGGGGLDAAGVRAAVGLASANLDTQLADIPTVAEFNARTLAAADYFDPATDAVANVTLVGTTTTNTDMRGTDNAATAAALATAQTSIDAIPTNAELATALAGIPKVGETKRYTNVDTAAAADVSITEVP